MNRRRVITGVAVVFAIAVWFATHDRPGPASAPPVRPAGVTAAGPRPRAIVGDATAIPAAAAVDDPAPVIDSTHDAVHAIGRRCWTARTPRTVPPGQPDDTVGRMELRLRIAIDGGQARVTASEVVSIRRLTDELRDCILAGVAATSWPVATPDGALEIVELFRMGDYTAPSPDQPPPPLPR